MLTINIDNVNEANVKIISSMPRPDSLLRLQHLRPVASLRATVDLGSLLHLLSRDGGRSAHGNLWRNVFRHFGGVLDGASCELL